MSIEEKLKAEMLKLIEKKGPLAWHEKRRIKETIEKMI